MISTKKQETKEWAITPPQENGYYRFIQAKEDGTLMNETIVEVLYDA